MWKNPVEFLKYRKRAMKNVTVPLYKKMVGKNSEKKRNDFHDGNKLRKDHRKIPKRSGKSVKIIFILIRKRY